MGDLNGYVDQRGSDLFWDHVVLKFMFGDIGEHIPSRPYHWWPTYARFSHAMKVSPTCNRWFARSVCDNCIGVSFKHSGIAPGLCFRLGSNLSGAETNQILGCSSFSGDTIALACGLGNAMVEDWRNEIFKYFDHRYTSGVVEQLNRLLGDINRAADGMDFQTLRAKRLLRYSNLIREQEFRMYPWPGLDMPGKDADDLIMRGLGFDPSTLAADLKASLFDAPSTHYAG